MESTFVDLLKPFILDHLWMGIVGVSVFVFKESIASISEGLWFKFNPDFSEDDIIFLDGRPARIQRIGWRTTVFYMLDSNPRRKYIVPNERIKTLKVEKELTVSREAELRFEKEQLELLRVALEKQIASLQALTSPQVQDTKKPPQ